MNFDFYLLKYLNNFAGRNLYLDTLAVFFGRYFGYILVLSLGLLLIKRYKKNFRMVLEALFGAMLAKEIFVDIIRQILPKPRPFIENDIYLLIDHTKSSSFPSAHTAFYFAIATTIFLYNKKIAPLFVVGAFLIAISRVFSGVHWPSDVLAGAGVGVFSALLVNIIAQKTLQE